MNRNSKASEHERRDWIIILIILLFGFLCVIIAGQWAIRLAPNWKLNTSMQSNLDPNSDFLTNKPVGYHEPIDPSILTQPPWFNIFLTPGALFETRTPVPPTNTPIETNTPIPASLTAIIPTNTPTDIIPSPTNTFIYFPPPPPPTRTPKPPPSALQVDLSITKTDNVTTYTAGSIVTYTIVVTNNGPNDVTGATISDPKPTQVTTWGWCATPSCTPIANSNIDLSDTINLASGASVTYTVSANIDAVATGDLVNTASVSAPSGYSDPILGNNSAIDTDTWSPSSADLQITKDDLVTTYTAGGITTYEIVVSNAGPSAVTGATVNDIFPLLITSASWTCTPTAGASCSSPNGSGNLVNHSIDLSVGSSVTYAVTANIHTNAVGNLVNTASVSVPTGFADPNPANNTATDSDTRTGPGSNINIGGPDGSSYNPGSMGSITILFSPAIIADGDVGTPDFVYYERLASLVPVPNVDLDWVLIEISPDGVTWYQVFYWHDPSTADTNTNVDLSIVGDVCFTNPGSIPAEIDNCSIPASRLYNSTGITVDIDSLVPPGSYPWMRISGVGGADGPDIDAIQPYYP